MTRRQIHCAKKYGERVMLHWFRKLLPRDDSFFPMFDQHASIIVKGAQSLRQMLDGGPAAVQHFDDVLKYEDQADEITRSVFLSIRTNFITPFDRGDIKDLITGMDDAIDQMKKTAKAINLFEMTTFEPEMRDMGDAILESARLVEQAVPLLANIGSNATKLNELCEEITRIEGRCDEIHEQGLKKLYLKSKTETPMEFIRGNEIYDHLEKSSDRFDDVANQIQAIVVEHV
jgi:predicted phosphate transport protein (TIGR00153 family)